MRGMTTPNIVKENEFLVHMLSHYPNVANPLKMEVGLTWPFDLLSFAR